MAVPPWHAAVVLAPGQLLLRLRLRVASRAVLLGAAATRHAPAHVGLLRRRALPDEEEQVDADHHAVAQQTLAPTAEGSSVLASSAALRDLSKEALGRPCKTSSTQEIRVQVISSMDNSTVDRLSYLHDPKAVRLLAEKSREIWEVPFKDRVEECVTALAMLLTMLQENISAPVGVVVQRITSNRSWYHVIIMLQLSGSSRTVSLLLKKMGRISVGCLLISVDSEYFTEFFSAEFGFVDKAVVLIGLKRRSQIQLRNFGFVEYEGEKRVVNARYQMLGKRMDVKDAVARPYLPAELQRNTSLRQFTHQWTKADHNLLDGELCEKHNIHNWCPSPVLCLPSWLPGFLVGADETHKERYPINDPEADSGAPYLVETGHGYDKPREHDNECRLTKVGDCADSDGLVIPIFLKHVSGELTLTISLNQPSQHLMHMYEQKTRMKLDCQYFVYKRKTLEPDHTLLFYGLERNTTVHVCGRVLGGKFTTLQQYVDDNSSKFTVKVDLPNKRISLEMTEKGCQFLSSWVKCFTTAFSRGQSWNGDFTLEDFKYSEGHIRYRKLPKSHCLPVSMANDLNLFIEWVKRILLCQDNPNLISNYPPYLEQFINFTNHLVSRLSATKHDLSSEDKLFLETHVCCMTSYARQRLIFELFRKYEGLDINEASAWEKAINSASCTITWKKDLPAKAPFFQECIDKATNKGVKYVNSRTSAFVFIKDIVLHAADKQTQNANTPELGDGIELMIPAYLEDFLPTIILNLIEKKVDISAELLEAVKCACRICDSSY